MNRSFRASALLSLLIAAFAIGQAHAAQFKGCKAGATSSLVVNVKARGAKGDGRTNDTEAIRRAINEVAGTGGTVFIPKGVYIVSAERNKHLKLRSKMTLRMANGAVLKMKPTAVARYAILKIPKAEDVNVIGGTLQGDRREHKARAGEWGMGIFISRDSRRINISNVRSRHMWGDGFYLGGAHEVAFCSVYAENNRRQGLSIVDGSRILVTNSVFRDTRGTRPSAGIDLEPDGPHHSITDVRIERSKFINNDGGGVMIAGKKGKIARVEIERNYFEGARPILIENSPNVASSKICNNRYVWDKGLSKGGFEKFADPADMIALQSDCKRGRDTRFEQNRNTKKKNQGKKSNKKKKQKRQS